MLKSTTKINNFKIKDTGKKGFTLIESLIAIFVLVVGLFAVIGFFPFALKIISDSKNLTIATNITTAKLEEVFSLNYDNIDTGTIEPKQRVSNDPDSYLYNYQRETKVEYIDSDFNPSQTDLGLKKITVTVFWPSSFGDSEKVVELKSIVTDY